MSRLVFRFILASVLVISAPLPLLAQSGSGNRLLAEARRLRAEGKLPASAGAYSRLVEMNPGGWEIRSELAQVLITMRELDMAEHHLQQAILISRETAALWSRLAQVYLLKEDHEHAEQSLVEARRLDPEDGGVRYNLALLYEKLTRHEEAFAEYKAFVDRGGSEDLLRKATRKVAQYLEYMGSQEEAIVYFRKLADLTPDQSWPRQQLAELLYRMARYDEALVEYQLILEMSPDNSAAHFNVGFIAKLRGDLETAEREMSIAISLGSETPKSHYHLGSVRFERGDFEGAASSFEKTIALEPDHVQAHYHYGRALLKLGRREEALREMELHKEVLKRRDEEHPSKTMDRSGEEN